MSESLGWKDRIQPDESIFEKRRFRNDVKAIAASSIAAQYFCEMKVEQGFIHGEVETEAKIEGDVLHEQLLEMRPTTREKLIEGIEKRKLFIASFPLATEFEQLVLVGVPDAVVFQDGRPTHLIELKTTRGDPAVVYDDQRAQVNVYGLLLDEMGFNCSGLKMIIVKFRRQNSMSAEEKSEFLQILTGALVSKMNLGELAQQSENGIVVHTLDYERDSSIRTLNQTMGYWLGEREPVPTTNPNKCRACEFKEVCPSSLVRRSRAN